MRPHTHASESAQLKEGIGLRLCSPSGGLQDLRGLCNHCRLLLSCCHCRLVVCSNLRARTFCSCELFLRGSQLLGGHVEVSLCCGLSFICTCFACLFVLHVFGIRR